MKKSAATGVHAIVGDKAFDSFRAEEELVRILQEEVGGFLGEAVEVFHGDETNWSRVLQAVRSRSLFAAQRAVVVRNADALKGEADAFASYLDDPTPGVTLILMAPKPDRRRTVWKRILQSANEIKVEPLKGQKLRAFVVDQVRKRGLVLDDAGFEELIERVGQDSRRLVSELDKLTAYFQGKHEPLSAREVAGVLGRGLARPLYELADAFAERRRNDVIERLGESLEEGEAPLRILATLHRVARQIRGVRALRQARVPREALASRLGVLPFKVPDLLEAERRWKDGELTRALTALGAADRRMKTGADPRVALEVAVIEACGREAATPSSRRGR